MGLAESASNNQALTAEMKSEIDRLRKTHELWRVYAPEWDLYLAAYEGGPEFATQGNLFKHARENQEDFADRVARVHYINYCEQIVDFFTNFIFAETIQRDGGDLQDWYVNFLKDVNKKGDDIETYMRAVSDDMQIFGMSYTLVDTPYVQLPEGETLTKADEEAQGIRPYWCLLRPDEITDWVVDDFDTFTYIKRKQMVNEVVGTEIKVVEKYTEWFQSQIIISRIDVTDSAKPIMMGKQIVTNTLGEIPIVVVRYKRSKRNPFMGNSFLRDFAKNNREIMNLTSLLQEFLYRQCFNLLAKEVEGTIPLKDQEDGVQGTANVLEVPKGAQMPEYISPPSDPARFIQEERDRIKQEMFRRAAQDTLNELFNGEKSSGFSQAQSFSKTVPFIASRADSLERAEQKLMALTARLAGKDWQGKIKYKDRYELTNLTDAMTQLQILGRDLGIDSETFFKNEFKRLVHEYDGKLPADLLAKVEREIEGMNWDKWRELQKEALVGAPKSPGDQQKPKSSGTMAEAAAEAKTPGAKAAKKVKGQ